MRHAATTAGRALVALCLLAARPAGRMSAQGLTPRDSAYHVLNRLAYGPRPGDVDSLVRLGVMPWIDRQLASDGIDDRALAERLRRFDLLTYSRGDLARLYLDAQRARRERQRADSMTPTPPSATGDGADAAPPPEELRARRIAGQLQQLAAVRAALSQRQLQEVMVDFWTNHFNVFVGKGADRFLTPSYIEETIRPRALGRFEDLLIATAQSPAMLFYLDNAESVAPGSVPPQVARLRIRTQFGIGPLPQRPPLFDPMRADSARQRALQRMPKGINENYARELMELHTLG